METISIDKSALADISNIIEELQDRIETIEIMNDKSIIESLKESKKQIQNREFGDWNELKDSSHKRIHKRL
jgi:uncharacterized membrane protein (DUF106 family)